MTAAGAGREDSAAELLPASAGSGPVVLVAHDSDVVREMICSVLLEAGFSVDTAADGVEALKKATENKPQAMVLDVGLPGIYGFELCERLKGNPGNVGHQDHAAFVGLRHEAV